MTLETFTLIVNGPHRRGWRRGQYLFNTLNEVRPDIAEAIRGTDVDPFYTDHRIPAAMARIAELWGKEV